jgi:hypothetical protein
MNVCQPDPRAAGPDIGQAGPEQSPTRGTG